MKPNNIEDIYPLSPMQQGILFHTLAASTPGSYVVQIAWTLRAEVDVAALRRAFQEAISRPPVRLPDRALAPALERARATPAGSA